MDAIRGSFHDAKRGGPKKRTVGEDEPIDNIGVGNVVSVWQGVMPMPVVERVGKDTSTGENNPKKTSIVTMVALIVASFLCQKPLVMNRITSI
jgi:hypothetical protein